MINESSDYENQIDLNNKNHSLTKIIERIKPNSKILEFGPAKGYLTKYFKEKLNCKIFCVEISEEFAQTAKQYSEKMVIGNLEILDLEKEFQNEKFDYIIFSDVLEHLFKPEKILRDVKKFLTEKGKLIVSIPNIAHSSIILNLIRDEFFYNATGLLDNTHIRFFTKKSLFRLFEANGYYVNEIDSTTASWDNVEFKFTKNEFPEEVLKFINKTNESQVYQYIFVVSKTDQDFSVSIENYKIELDNQKEEYNHLEKQYNEVVQSTSYKISLKLMKFLNKILFW